MRRRRGGEGEERKCREVRGGEKEEEVAVEEEVRGQAGGGVTECVFS